ncbi:LON peptidase substrate-binding domain-containing protein [Thermobifida halotolerans]|uniref:LON peptidase substrate-binding domain-containing protein n=1 Tax=Thermobifida halotolerans TaxID=483545 RepID=A0A399G5F7_9ACTN|nr:LON peptidase substrate-binding domain-containing protein [Thermobifida halotolerans]UOE20265.1 LON peptidase substrate-binding domain-containing protein [Thermobifida halotolerans]
MSTRLPLFPLGSVLFPGLTLALHVFEDRYLRLVDDLMALPADRPRSFGVVGIRLGHEVGERAAHQMADVGCVAEISAVQHRSDSGLDLVVTGVARFRVEELVEPDEETPYLRAEVSSLPDEIGADAEVWNERVARRFTVYRERLDRIGVSVGETVDLPDKPLELSYSVADALVLDMSDKQALLEAEDAAARLELAAGLLRRENRVLSALRLLPAGRFPQQVINLN